MATVLRNTGPGKADPMSPEAVMARISEHAREMARRDGGLAAVHAVDGFRTAYKALWARFENETIPFMAEEGGRS